MVRASRIGDVVCATPAFRALRAALPGARITLVGLPFARDLVARSPHLDAFEPFPGFPGIAEQWFDARRAARFFRRMQARRFDLALQMHGSGVYANPFTLMLGARVTAGFVRPGDGPGLLDAALPLPEGLPEVERPLALAAFLGAPPRGRRPEFPLWPEDHHVAASLLAGAPRPLVGVHPAGTEATKRWPPERFGAAAAALRAREGGTVVVLGGPGERPLADAVARAAGPPCLNLAGRTTLPVLGAVLARLAVLLTTDSGPAHVAYALGVPSVTVFGGTDPWRWAPPAGGPHAVLARPVPCRPCGYDECPVGYPCLAAVTVEEAVAAAEGVLRRAEGPAQMNSTR